MNSYADRLRATLPRVREAIAAAASAAGRENEGVLLVAVTKGHPLEAALAARDQGLVDLGENRVEELEWKVSALGRADVRWHMIGHLQRRKASRALAVAHLIHSVDTLRLARRLDRAAAEEGSPADVLVQVNTSGEQAKSGLAREGAVEAVLEISALPNLRVRGLMTMAPFVDDEAVLRATFAALRETLAEARVHDPSVGKELSMGMTHDLRYAVEEGSTLVRVGTALFGPRPGFD